MLSLTREVLMASCALACLLAALPAAQKSGVLLDNSYVTVTRNGAPCASAASPGCRDRIVVALGSFELRAAGKNRRLARGDIAVFGAGQSYAAPAAGEFLEVVLKPDHPPVQHPPARIAPEKNQTLYDGERFFIFEERLPPGETRARHSHRQRVVVVLNDTDLRQRPDGGAEVVRKQVPHDVHFNPPVAHAVTTTGAKPMRNLVI